MHLENAGYAVRVHGSARLLSDAEGRPPALFLDSNFCQEREKKWKSDFTVHWP